MRLKELVEGLAGAQIVDDPEEIEVGDIQDDSRQVGPGSLFVAIKGAHTDGHDHVPAAVRRGAVAVITEEAVENHPAIGIRVSDSAKALAHVSARFFGNPSERITLVGITGTNGKTTTSLLIQSILEASGRRTGLIGTLRYEIGEAVTTALNTTPNALLLQSLLHRMVQDQLSACVMEVSSHALALGRTRKCHFDVRVFTNLTRDHLDFHPSMEAYYGAKARLFEGAYAKPGGVSVVNLDDSWGRQLIQRCAGPVLTFGINEDADFRALDSKNTLDGLAFRIQTPSGDMNIESPLVGRYNIYNILSAAAVGFSLGISAGDIRSGISRVKEIPGRFEKIAGPGFTAVVDYAHTHDALDRLLHNARQLCRGRLITIFGCGGDRDRGKRPLMGKVSAALSDRVIVTSDNPRTEDAEKIIDDILAGIKEPRPGQVEAIPDRRRAIQEGISMAREGDMVVVAGKGHEDYQILGEKKIPFDDREEIRQAFRRREKQGHEFE